MSRSPTIFGALATVLIAWLGFGIPAAGQAGNWGVTDNPEAAQLLDNGELISPGHVFAETLYSTGGVSLRNQSQGSIQLAGDGSPPPPAFAAVVYWAIIDVGVAPPPARVLHVQKRDPAKSRNVKLQGTIVGVGPDPCWPGDTITVLRAAIPLDVVNAGGGHAGVFDVRINCHGPWAPSSCLGEDPWGAVLGPRLFEGASIVAFWEQEGWTTSVYDVGLAGLTMIGLPAGGVTFNLALPVPLAGGAVLWDNIGADGQHGSSRSASVSVSDETTTINGTLVAGPGSPYTDSDWNGNDSNPIPSLWDTTGHQFTPATLGNILSVTFASAGGVGTDCLTPVANIVAQ